MDLTALYEKYGQEKVDEAVKLLTYKTTPIELPKIELPDTPTLFVFRHGQSVDNKDFIFSGWRDVELSEEGKKEAEILAEKLRNKKIQMLISSDQKRAIETMRIAMSQNPDAKNLEITQDQRLRERSYGDWESTSKLEMELADPEGLAKVRRGWDDRPPHGESIADVNKRVDEFLDEIVPLMRQHRINIALVCSSNSIRPIRKRFESLSEEEVLTIDTPTGKDYAAYPIL